MSLMSDPYWDQRAWPWLKQRHDTTDWHNLVEHLHNPAEFSVVFDLWREASPERKDAMKPFGSSALAKAQVSMAITANLCLLYLFLQVMSPQEIVAGCNHLVAKQRTSIMLHLHP